MAAKKAKKRKKKVKSPTKKLSSKLDTNAVVSDIVRTLGDKHYGPRLGATGPNRRNSK
jgi:hypothetical protein